MGSLNQSHPPGNSVCHNIRLRSAWYNMTRVYWEKWAFHVMEREHTGLTEIESRAKTLWELLLGEGANLGYALRRHNAKMHQAGTPGQCIILQDVLEDWMSMRYDLTLERTAAVIHLQTMLMASAMLHEWAAKMETYNDLLGVRRTIQSKLKSVKGTFDLRDDIWKLAATTSQVPTKGRSMPLRRETALSLASVTSSRQRRQARSPRVSLRPNTLIIGTSRSCQRMVDTHRRRQSHRRGIHTR